MRGREPQPESFKETNMWIQTPHITPPGSDVYSPESKRFAHQ